MVVACWCKRDVLAYEVVAPASTAVGIGSYSFSKDTTIYGVLKMSNKKNAQSEALNQANTTSGNSEALTSFAELEAKVENYLNSWQEAGEALDKIKGMKDIYKSQDKTWSNYVQRRFGFSPQYANTLIYASKCLKTQRELFQAKKNPANAFEHLPHSANFWYQAYKLNDESKCHDALVALLDEDGNLLSDWNSKWTEVIEDNNAKARKTRKADGKNDDVKNIVDSILKAIKDSVVSDNLKTLSARRMKEIVKMLLEEIAKTNIEDSSNA